MLLCSTSFPSLEGNVRVAAPPNRRSTYIMEVPKLKNDHQNSVHQ